MTADIFSNDEEFAGTIEESCRMQSSGSPEELLLIAEACRELA